MTSTPNTGATVDNILDIIDIVHGDTVLDNNANQGGANGFSQFPINANNAGQFLEGTVNRYQDDSAQTQFWAKFIVGANTLTAKANAAVTSGNTTMINSVISEIQAYQKFGADFDSAQGGIFGARFDNELLSGTLLEDANAAIQGLKSGNAVLVAAAGSGFIADAKDVSGNNVPVTGGAFNGNATTITQALSMAHSTGAGTSGSTQTTGGTPTGSPTGTPPASPPPTGGGVSGGAPSPGSSGTPSGSPPSGSSTSGSSAASGNTGSSGSTSSSSGGETTAADHHHHHSFEHVWHHM
jgi:trimeric autotransporter adhesin